MSDWRFCDRTIRWQGHPETDSSVTRTEFGNGLWGDYDHIMVIYYVIPKRALSSLSSWRYIEVSLIIFIILSSVEISKSPNSPLPNRPLPNRPLPDRHIRRTIRCRILLVTHELTSYFFVTETSHSARALPKWLWVWSGLSVRNLLRDRLHDNNLF